MNPTPEVPNLTLEQVQDLADDLIRQLSEHPGDDDAVCAVLTHWHDTLDTPLISFVCMAAIRVVFGECLVPHPERIPADGLTVSAPAPTGVEA